VESALAKAIETLLVNITQRPLAAAKVCARALQERENLLQEAAAAAERQGNNLLPKQDSRQKRGPLL
jgi:hypothetical protein